MTLPTDPDDREAIRQLIKKMSDAWLSGRADELTEYFDEEIVMVAPGFQGRMQGREAAITSFKDFMQQATVKEYKQSDPDVDVWGETAVAAYSWEMAYSMNEASYAEKGWDVFVFARKDGKWRAVWRTLMTSG